MKIKNFKTNGALNERSTATSLTTKSPPKKAYYRPKFIFFPTKLSKSLRVDISISLHVSWWCEISSKVFSGVHGCTAGRAATPTTWEDPTTLAGPNSTIGPTGSSSCQLFSSRIFQISSPTNSILFPFLIFKIINYFLIFSLILLYLLSF